MWRQFHIPKWSTHITRQMCRICRLCLHNLSANGHLLEHEGSLVRIRSGLPPGDKRWQFGQITADRLFLGRPHPCIYPIQTEPPVDEVRTIHLIIFIILNDVEPEDIRPISQSFSEMDLFCKHILQYQRL